MDILTTRYTYRDSTKVTNYMDWYWKNHWNLTGSELLQLHTRVKEWIDNNIPYGIVTYSDKEVFYPKHLTHKQWFNLTYDERHLYELLSIPRNIDFRDSRPHVLSHSITLLCREESFVKSLNIEKKVWAHNIPFIRYLVNPNTHVPAANTYLRVDKWFKDTVGVENYRIYYSYTDSMWYLGLNDREAFLMFLLTNDHVV